MIIMAINILIGLCIVGLIFYTLKFFNTFRKESITLEKTNDRKTKQIDFDDEILAMMSEVVGKKLNYVDPYLAKYLIVMNYRHNDHYHGTKQLDCKTVENRFHLYEDKNGNKFIKIISTKNYGSPQWINQEMIYNYPMITKDYSCSVDKFNELWPMVKETFFIIEPESENNSERVQNGRLSYWTEKEFGHMID